MKEKDDEKDIALGTSKTNYNDPRISVAWCKANEVKIERVFPKNLLSKFLWAMYTDAEWEFWAINGEMDWIYVYELYLNFLIYSLFK